MTSMHGLRFTDGGIDYELGFVPAFAMQLELMPFAQTNLKANGILAYAAYETVFSAPSRPSAKKK